MLTKKYKYQSQKYHSQKLYRQNQKFYRNIYVYHESFMEGIK